MTVQNKKPPIQRTPIWAPITEAARQGKFLLQLCPHCRSLQYPPREICKDCLGDELVWESVSNQGELISHTVLHASTNAFFRENVPRQIALVKLDAGALVFAHLACESAKTGDRAYLLNRIDLSGESVFVAIVEGIEEKLQLDDLKILFPQTQ